MSSVATITSSILSQPFAGVRVDVGKIPSTTKETFVITAAHESNVLFYFEEGDAELRRLSDTFYESTNKRDSFGLIYASDERFWICTNKRTGVPPGAISYDEGILVSINKQTGTTYPYTAPDIEHPMIAAAGICADVTEDGDQNLYIADSTSENLGIIASDDLETNNLKPSIYVKLKTVTGGAGGVTMNKDGDGMFVTLTDDDSIAFVKTGCTTPNSGCVTRLVNEDGRIKSPGGIMRSRTSDNEYFITSKEDNRVDRFELTKTTATWKQTMIDRDTNLLNNHILGDDHLYALISNESTVSDYAVGKYTYDGIISSGDASHLACTAACVMTSLLALAMSLF